MVGIRGVVPLTISVTFMPCMNARPNPRTRSVQASIGSEGASIDVVPRVDRSLTATVLGDDDAPAWAELVLAAPRRQ